MRSNEKIVFFDGYCTLCNSVVDGLIVLDRNSVLRFASLQGETARRLLAQKDLEIADPDTIVYLRDGERYERSTAVLMILRDLGGSWKLISIFFFVPRPLRDLGYRFVAKIRYRVFGKRDTCRLPTAEERERLLP
ncbi:MAG: DCC1-like thiol-disulfide oxidoreductase family protein [Bdellovibrionota bacterium]